MELFSLVAKLTLDKKEYEKDIRSIENSDIEAPDVKIGVQLDRDDFDSDIEAIPNTKVGDIKDSPSVKLDDKGLYDDIDEIPDANVDDIEDEPEVTLNEKQFASDMAAIPDTEVDDIEDQPALTLDKSDLDEKLPQAEEEIEGFTENVGGMFEGIATAITAAGIIALIEKLYSFMKDAINSTAQLADTIDKGSEKIGVSTKTYQVWAHALQQSGGDIGELSRGMMKFRDVLSGMASVTYEEAEALKKLGINIYEADGHTAKSRKTLMEEAKGMVGVTETTEETAAAFEVLSSLMQGSISMTDDQRAAFEKLQKNGFSFYDEAGEMKNAEQLFQDALLAASDITDQDERLKIINDLFGRNVTGIVNLVKTGKDEVTSLLNEAEDLGLIMSDEEIQNAVAYGDSVANLMSSIEHLKADFVESIIPVLKEAVDMVTEIVAFFRGETGATAYKKKFSEADQELADTIEETELTGDAALNLIDKLYALGDVTRGTKEEQSEWLAIVTALKEDFPSLAHYFDEEKKSIDGEREAIENDIKALQKLALEKAVAEAKAKKYQALVDQNEEAFDAYVELQREGAQFENATREAIEGINAWLGDDTGDVRGYKGRIRERLEKRYGTSELTSDMEASQLYAMIETIQKGEKSSQQKSQWTKLASGFSTASLEYYQALEKYMQYDEEMKKAQEEYEAWSQTVDNLVKDWEEGKKKTKEITDEVKQTDITSSSVLRTEEEVTKEYDKQYQKLKLINEEEEKRSLFDTGLGDVPSVRFPHAKGLWDVPYDNYPADLHRGEMVLTASQARQYRDGGTGVDYARLERAVITAIREGMDGVTVDSYINGRKITEEVSRELGAQLAGGRYR